MTVVPDRDRRICEVAVCILDGAASKRLNVVVLNKALFYADLLALRDYGDTLTGSSYLAIPKGPVIEGYEKRLVRSISRLGWAQQEMLGMAKPLRKVATPDEYEFLAAEHQERARYVGRRCEQFTSSKLSEYSHDNLGWIAANEAAQRVNGKGQRINMVLAMQQLEIEDADWLDAPLTPEERAHVDRDEPAHPW